MSSCQFDHDLKTWQKAELINLRREKLNFYCVLGVRAYKPNYKGFIWELEFFFFLKEKLLA